MTKEQIMIKPEPLGDLKEEILNMIDYWNEDPSLMRNEGLEAIMGKIKQRIKSACEFYLRYKDKPKLLIKEHPEFKEKLETVFDYLTENLLVWNPKVREQYNEWLFKLALLF